MIGVAEDLVAALSLDSGVRYSKSRFELNY
ncbi:Uncharacterised protein [Mycobacteroides abscessus subsp. bolletii]|nr:Uncharacterised protein [Mycobacteroides abscessus subsp. bolletii]SKX37503.1 Uncharacterised protein [Mycobacteroides abscessus subsp. bolletii]